MIKAYMEAKEPKQTGLKVTMTEDLLTNKPGDPQIKTTLREVSTTKEHHTSVPEFSFDPNTSEVFLAYPHFVSRWKEVLLGKLLMIELRGGNTLTWHYLRAHINEIRNDLMLSSKATGKTTDFQGLFKVVFSNELPGRSLSVVGEPAKKLFGEFSE